jgi:diketogulonate reductase-like aldo/keto reductase
LFLSKDVTAAQASQQVEKAVNALLDKLQIQTLDLLVVATPHHNEINEFKTIWEAMESCVSRGLVKALGVVNFSTTQLAALLEIAAIRPVVNQIPLTQLTTAADRALLSYAKSNGIELRPHPVTDATLDVTGIKPPRRVTRTHKETESYQVQWALRYSITAKHQFLTTARGFVYSVHNSTTERITAN